MIIIRQRLFSKYPSTWQRIKRAGSAGLHGLAYGAIPGGVVGSLGGKKGAVIGALTTGIPVGAISAAASWQGSSKSRIDLENESEAKAIAIIKEFERNAVKDPRGVFAPLADSVKKIAGYKNFEKKYSIEFPSEFYKFIKLQEDFIPIAVKWVKDNNGKESYHWKDVIPFVYYSENIEDQWIDCDEIKEANSLDVIYFEDYPDDSIEYYPKTKKFAWGRGNGSSLKQVILYFADETIKGVSYSKELTSLAKLYKNFIRTRL